MGNISIQYLHWVLNMYILKITDTMQTMNSIFKEIYIMILKHGYNIKREGDKGIILSRHGSGNYHYNLEYKSKIDVTLINLYIILLECRGKVVWTSCDAGVYTVKVQYTSPGNILSIYAYDLRALGRDK